MINLRYNKSSVIRSKQIWTLQMPLVVLIVVAYVRKLFFVNAKAVSLPMPLELPVTIAIFWYCMSLSWSWLINMNRISSSLLYEVFEYFYHPVSIRRFKRTRRSESKVWICISVSSRIYLSQCISVSSRIFIDDALFV